MENASKALLIAGGVLLAVLVLSLFGLLLSNISSNQMAQEKTKQAEQLKEFNQQWEAYNKKALYGTDIITVMNMAIENNSNAETLNDYVNITIKFENSYLIDDSTLSGIRSEFTKNINGFSLYKKQGKELRILRIFSTLNKITNNTIKVDSEDLERELVRFKMAFFKCTGVKYKDGRITELNFEEI